MDHSNLSQVRKYALLEAGRGASRLWPLVCGIRYGPEHLANGGEGSAAGEAVLAA